MQMVFFIGVAAGTSEKGCKIVFSNTVVIRSMLATLAASGLDWTPSGNAVDAIKLIAVNPHHLIFISLTKEVIGIAYTF